MVVLAGWCDHHRRARDRRRSPCETIRRLSVYGFYFGVFRLCLSTGRPPEKVVVQIMPLLRLLASQPEAVALTVEAKVFKRRKALSVDICDAGWVSGGEPKVRKWQRPGSASRPLLARFSGSRHFMAGKQLESSKTVWGEARELFAAAIIYDADGAYCLFGFGDAFGLGCVLVLATADRN